MSNPVRTIGSAVAVIAVAAGLQLAGASAAQATDEHTSCIGHEASSISPPGSSDGFAGGVPELIVLVQGLADEFGIPSGAIVRSEAHRHAGSHEACDASE